MARFAIYFRRVDKKAFPSYTVTMKKWRRTVFFWILTLLCLVTIPLVVLNAAGYRFDTSRGAFVYSGTITFKSNPQNISVTLDGKPTDSQQINKINNSVNLSGLIPKNYNIAISAPGFQTWTKEADVSSGLATEFWNVVLARNNYPKTRLGADGTQKFFIAPKNDFLAYTTENSQNLGVGIFNISAKKTTTNLSLPGWQFAGDDRHENIEWGPDEAYISVPVKKTVSTDSTDNQNISGPSTVSTLKTPKNTTTYDYSIANPKDGTYFDLKQFLNADTLNSDSNDIRAVRWDPKEKGCLFFLIGKTLYRANIQTQGDITKIADGVSAYDLSSSGVYYVQTPNNLVFEKNLDGSGNPNQITSTFPGFGNQDIARLTVYDNSRIAFLTPDGDLYVYNQGDHATYFKQLDSGIVDA
ncbi:MAG: PEGA domain-containing protein, partial [Candidatus Pacebacteria bacterium]|nr:PEGA domain-containing protein [Candidatus Paceibacterota bacterium]